MHSAGEPELSVIVATPDHFDVCRRTVACLQKQTARRRIELVIVAPSEQELGLIEGEVECFHSTRIVEIGRMTSTGRAIAEGYRAARAPVVTYAEEHSFPEPPWAETLIREHAKPYAAVGAAMGNANPHTLVSWANLYGEFGAVVEPVQSGLRKTLGSHHTSYKREVLLGYGSLLAEMMENEYALFIDLCQKGHTLYLAGDALSYHTNVSDFKSFLRIEFRGARGFGAARAHVGNWSVWRRALYIAGSPLIPFIRIRRILREIRRSRRDRQLLPQIILILIPASLFSVLGEVTGYLFGDTPENLRARAEVELDRYAYLSPSDPHRVSSGPA